jgi:hypothetical protein
MTGLSFQLLKQQAYEVLFTGTAGAAPRVVSHVVKSSCVPMMMLTVSHDAVHHCAAGRILDVLRCSNVGFDIWQIEVGRDPVFSIVCLVPPNVLKRGGC